MFLSQKEKTISKTVVEASHRFPNWFGERLYKGVHILFGTTPSKFIEKRSEKHLKKILLSQFFLQKRIERALSNKEREVTVRIFSFGSKICIATLFSYKQSSEIFNKHHILSSLDAFIAGVKEIPDSFYSCYLEEQTHLFCYLEVEKLRGKELSTSELKKLQIDLEKQITNSITCHCPTIFWPYNHEESYREIFVLNKEIHTPQDLPQVSLHFKGLTISEVEFLVHIVCPKAYPSIEEILDLIPSSLFHFCADFKMARGYAFSIYLPIIQPNQAINLIMIRKSVITLLQEAIGPFRDFNGGLFTKQEEAFSQIKVKLADRIPSFSLFAEKLFYSLKPIEKQITFESAHAELLFRVFASIMNSKKSFDFQHYENSVLVIKSKERARLEPLVKKAEKLDDVVFALLQLSESYYFVLLDPVKNQTSQLLPETLDPSLFTTSKRSLRLAVQIGLPPSLNPYYLVPDLRCRTIYKFLFEGLTRLNQNHRAVLAGAQSVQRSTNNPVYTFILRPNRWSNGEKVTAFHFERGWKEVLSFADRIDAKPFRYIKNGESILKGEASPDVFGVYARDSKTLEIHLERPDPYFLERLAQPLFFPTYDRRKEPELFNGPFALYTREHDLLVLEKNFYFWNRKEVYFDRVEIRNILKLSQIITLYQEKKIDWIGDPFIIFPLEYQQSLKRIRNQKVCRPFCLYFNTKDPLLEKQTIRQALSLSANIEEIVSTFSLSTSFEPCLPRVNFNPKLAKEYLALSGESHVLCYLTYSPVIGGKKLAALLKKNWEKYLGIKVILIEENWNTLFHSLQKGRYQIAGSYLTPTLKEPLEFLERIAPYSPLNFPQYQNDAYTNLILQARQLSDGNDKEVLLKEAKDILDNDLPFIFLFNKNHTYTHSSSLKGYKMDPCGGVDLSYAYLEK
ncbi:MAG: peptide ABC transporter substrate-binding protein [Chlamydiales bacterium]